MAESSNNKNIAKKIRLQKVATEFNVGKDTIIEFLKKKGFTISSNPNTPVEPELYDIIAKEFRNDKELKSEASNINISLKNNDAKPASTDHKPEHNQNTDSDYAKEEEYIIKTSLSSANVLNNETHKQKNLADDSDANFISTKIKGPEIIGKIDLSKFDSKSKNKSKQQNKTTDASENAVTATNENIEQKVATTEDKGTTATNNAEQQVIAKTTDVTENNITDSAKDVVENKSTDNVTDNPVVQNSQPETTTGTTDEPTKDTAVKTEPVENDTQVTRADDKAQKVEQETGKVTDDKDDKSSPKQDVVISATDEKQQPTADRSSKDGNDLKSRIQTSEDDNFIDIRAPKIAGPKVLGTIELPVEKPISKKSDANKDKNKKQKRPRIRQGAETSQDKINQPQQQNKNKGTGKPADNNAKKDKDNKKGKKKGKSDNKPVISEVDVNRQVHETLSSLTQKSKSKSALRRREKRHMKSAELSRLEAANDAERSILKVTEFVTVSELATLMNVPPTEVIKSCMELGVYASINQRLNAETLSLVADEFGFKVEFVGVEIHEPTAQNNENMEDTEPRHPIVTVMGHVDHGKTSLLDYIRNSNVIAGEAGGITQHIGAYEVHLEDGRNITFLDTPGHEAFTAMRARGAQITDVVIVVVAADDNVMPQTIEAINHAQAAGVPIIIAINKIDKPTADVDKIKRQLADINIVVEDWGGKYQCQEISAKKGINIDLLLEKVLLEADILELKCNPAKRAEGAVIESKLDKGRGYISIVLVQNGTLHVGDVVLAGTCYGKVKALFNERKQKIDTCGPASPVQILGLNGAPQAGDKFLVLQDEHEAKAVADKRAQLQREMDIRTQKHITLEEIGRRIAIGDFKELNIIVKADVDGSSEALSDSLLKLSTPEVQVNIIHKAVGQITETDVSLAAASDAVIVGFNVRPSAKAHELASKEHIDIRTYSVIYKAIEEIKDAIKGMLAPEYEEKIVCNVEVREVYHISKVGNIAGGYVQNGAITRNTSIRIIRDGVVIHTGKLSSLKRYKDDVREVKAGLECGLSVDNYNDIQVGDIIEGFEEVEVERK